MKKLTVEQHRKRIENLQYAAEKIQRYTREIKIRDYMPGQVAYHMGLASVKFSMAPTEYDVERLTTLANQGYEWIQLHDDCIDRNRYYGGDTFNPFDVEGTKKFVNLCHDLGLKIIPYISSSYFPDYDPDYRADFAKIKAGFECPELRLQACDAGSPTWRKYHFEKMFETLDRFGFDGVYNDMGYDKFLKMYFDEIEKYGFYKSHVKEMPYDPEVEDYLGMIYYELKRRGLYCKVHIGDYLRPPVKDKVYDYLWVGEAGATIRGIVDCKHYDPFLVPGFDRRTSKIEDPDIVYALTLPFVQFPLLYNGRPCGALDPAEMKRRFNDPENRAAREDAIREWYLAHPDGPHVYSEWSSIPDDPTEMDRSANYLALYKPMVSQDSVAKVEIRKASFITSDIPEEIYISMFTNEEQYLLVANTMDKNYQLQLTEKWTDRVSGQAAETFTVAPGKLLFLIK